MITTEELEVWKSKITSTMTKALTSEKQSRGAEKAYFRNIAEVANAQLSIVQRLIVQSKENDELEDLCQK